MNEYAWDLIFKRNSERYLNRDVLVTSLKYPFTSRNFGINDNYSPSSKSSTTIAFHHWFYYRGKLPRVNHVCHIKFFKRHFLTVVRLKLGSYNDLIIWHFQLPCRSFFVVESAQKWFRVATGSNSAMGKAYSVVTEPILLRDEIHIWRIITVVESSCRYEYFCIATKFSIIWRITIVEDSYIVVTWLPRRFHNRIIAVVDCLTVVVSGFSPSWWPCVKIHGDSTTK